MNKIEVSKVYSVYVVEENKKFNIYVSRTDKLVCTLDNPPSEEILKAFHDLYRMAYVIGGEDTKKIVISNLGL